MPELIIIISLLSCGGYILSYLLVRLISDKDDNDYSYVYLIFAIITVIIWIWICYRAILIIQI